MSTGGTKTLSLSSSFKPSARMIFRLVSIRQLIPDSTRSMVSALKPATMATLIQVARDVYPHDRLADRYYATAMKAHDNADQAPMIEQWVSYLNQLAMTAGSARYAETPREQDRVALLRKIEGSEFFKTVQGGMVVGLYNNPEVWPLFGFEGESFSKGGYINRGFDDIDWL